MRSQWVEPTVHAQDEHDACNATVDRAVDPVERAFVAKRGVTIDQELHWRILVRF
jgi:hypothetical protein